METIYFYATLKTKHKKTRENAVNWMHSNRQPNHQGSIFGELVKSSDSSVA